MIVWQDRNLNGDSSNWLNWMSVLSLTTCVVCDKKHGSIYSVNDHIDPQPPIHLFCKCQLVSMRTVRVGMATDNEINGADSYLYYIGELPDYYISIQDAQDLGWNAREGNLGVVAPGKMLYGGVFSNRETKLPQVPGRIWYEADINYTGGHRGCDRILFSNDGLLFASYDHYKTFYEIVG